VSTKSISHPKSDTEAETPAILQPGDRLRAAEFRSRYETMPDLRKAELIEGIVYVPSPVRVSNHAEPHANLITWLGSYRAQTPICAVADNATVRLDLDNEPQPDVTLFIRPEFGGQAKISADDYLVGGPEFVAEISSSTLAVDRGPKLRTFLRHMVREYLIWRVEDDLFEWYVLRGSDYALLTCGDDEILRSEVFPGLWLDTKAMLAGDLAAVLDVVREGTKSPEHERFCQSS
jgi:hypothetical protein